VTLEVVVVQTQVQVVLFVSHQLFLCHQLLLYDLDQGVTVNQGVAGRWTVRCYLLEVSREPVRRVHGLTVEITVFSVAQTE
jgi:hypothetical protein